MSFGQCNWYDTLQNVLNNNHTFLKISVIVYNCITHGNILVFILQ